MQIIEHSLMKNKTTMRLGGTAYQEIIVEQYHDADSLLQHLEKEQVPCYILGGGSNLLIDSEPLDACVIRSAYTQDIRILDENEHYIHIESPLSLPLQRFIKYAIQHGAQGFEGLAGVPGTLGGALAMNAGSFGCELARFLQTIDILSLTDGIVQYTQEDFTIGYRSFQIPAVTSGYLGLKATFLCPKKSPHLLQEQFSENINLKRSRQPLSQFSAGCIFKNPPQYSAWKLLEEAGMKELPSQHFHFSQQHANFLIHDGHGSLDEALFLIEKAKHNVLSLSHIILELEVRIWTTRNIALP